MITVLHIQNVGIIQDVTIEFQEGFQVLTGETGAGKSLIIDSLEIISGGRFSKDMIRKGEDHSFVEISLYVPNHVEANEDGTIIVSREIYASGRNTCKINNRLVTVSKLRHFMKEIIDIHGQHDNQSLFEVSYHGKMLDAFAGPKLTTLKQEYQQLYMRYQTIVTALKKNGGSEQERQRTLDLLEYQIQEKMQANLQMGEDITLEEERNKLLHYEMIAQNLSVSCETMDSQVLSGLASSIKALEKIGRFESEYEKKYQQVQSMYYELQEITRELSFAKEGMEYDTYRATEIEQRLDEIHTLQRKYGNTIEDILQYQVKLEEQRDQIQNRESHVLALQKELEDVEKNMQILCENIHQIRVEYATILQKRIDLQLQELDMKQAHFTVQVVSDERGNFHGNGWDSIEFFIQTNAGEESMPLLKIASGGEISRIMLAIKTVISDIDVIPVMVFDEIDTGISGSAAKAVRHKIKEIAKKHQIITVTHLPIITASADHHFKVEKVVRENETQTRVVELKEKEVIQEIAWISTGEITATALQHALELKKMV